MRQNSPAAEAPACAGAVHALFVMEQRLCHPMLVSREESDREAQLIRSIAIGRRDGKSKKVTFQARCFVRSRTTKSDLAGVLYWLVSYGTRLRWFFRASAFLLPGRPWRGAADPRLSRFARGDATPEQSHPCSWLDYSRLVVARSGSRDRATRTAPQQRLDRSGDQGAGGIATESQPDRFDWLLRRWQPRAARRGASTGRSGRPPGAILEDEQLLG